LAILKLHFGAAFLPRISIETTKNGLHKADANRFERLSEATFILSPWNRCIGLLADLSGVYNGLLCQWFCLL
jgi:hypothetical protein